MDIQYELKYLELEESGWWFRARRDIILRLLPRHKQNFKILDIGCSGGALLKVLIDKGYTDVWGVDISHRSIERAQSLGIKNVVVRDAVETGFSNESFDIVIASDTLEHIKKEKEALREWYRILRSGGQLFVFVPAHQFLWSEHDVVNHHVKRYSKKELRSAIAMAGFQIMRAGYWDFLLFFPAFLVRFLPTRKSKKDQLDKYSPFINWIVYRLIVLENILIQWGIPLPAGVSLFCIGRKKVYGYSHIGDTKSSRYEHKIYRAGSYDDSIWQIEKKILRKELAYLKMRYKQIEYLDFACGSGRVLAYLENDVEKATGVDISLSMLEIARIKAQKADLLEADITKKDVLRARSFDLITAFRFYLNAESPLRDAAFTLLKEKLRTGGSLFIFNVHGNAMSFRVFTKLWMRWNGRKLNTSTYWEVKNFLRSHGLTLVRWYGVGVLPKICYRVIPSRITLFLDRLFTFMPLSRYIAQDLIFVCKRRSDI